MLNLLLVCFPKVLQSESRLCRLGRSVSKQLCVIICLVEVIILYSKLGHSVDNNIEMLLPQGRQCFVGGGWGRWEERFACDVVILYVLVYGLQTSTVSRGPWVFVSQSLVILLVIILLLDIS